MRHDYIRLDRKTLTPDKNGFLNIPVNAARVGVYTYLNSDGSKRRELRLPEEVFKEDSMRTLALKPATFEHEGGMVNSATVSKFTVGSVGDAIKQEGDFLTCNMGVHKKDAVDSVLDNLEKGKPMGLSPGYDCDIEEKSGDHPKYGRYDCIQRNIVFNHLTLTENPRGNGCNLRLDSEDAAMIEDDSINNNHNQKDVMSVKQKIAAFKVGKAHFDSESIEYPQEAESAVNTVLARLALVEEEATKNQGHLDSMTAERDGLKTQLEGKDKELKEKQTHLDSSVSQEKIHEEVIARASLISFGKFKDEEAKTMTTKEMKKKIVLDSKLYEDNEDLDNDMYLKSAFDVVAKRKTQMPKVEESHLDSWEDLNEKGAVTQTDEIDQLSKMRA